MPDSNVSLRFGPVAILVVKTKAEPPEAQIVQGRFNLSNAEMRIVEGLLAGKSLAGIAGERAVSLGTVRSQVKSIFAKTDVRRQSQLVALLHHELLRGMSKK